MALCGCQLRWGNWNNFALNKENLGCVELRCCHSGSDYCSVPLSWLMYSWLQSCLSCQSCLDPWSSLEFPSAHRAAAVGDLYQPEHFLQREEQTFYFRRIDRFCCIISSDSCTIWLIQSLGLKKQVLTFIFFELCLSKSCRNCLVAC